MRGLIYGILMVSLACTPTEQPPVAAPASLAQKPRVVHLPGIGGLCDIDQTLQEGLVRGGFNGPFEFFDWTCNDRGIPALHNGPRNRAQAKLLAEKLVKFIREEPQRPVYLVSHSGGAGIAVWALEELPAGMRVASLVMLGPALSPEYNLSRALEHVTGRVLSFYSTRDEVILGSGTRLLGTIDGQRTDAAGRVGFRVPAAGDPAQYKKLDQRQYMADWMRLGNQGGHLGWMSSAFACGVVAPLMQGREPTEADFASAGPVVPAPTPDILPWQK